MIVLRCTRKFADFAGVKPRPPGPTDPDLEWYAQLLWIDRRKCVLFTHATTLFAFLVPDVRKADVTALDEFFVRALRVERISEALPPDTFGVQAGTTVVVAPAVNRSVLGSMNGFALYCKHRVSAEGALARTDITDLNRRLRQTPMGGLEPGSGMGFPMDHVHALIARRGSDWTPKPVGVSELSIAKVQRFCDRATPPHVRDQMVWKAESDSESITIHEHRPPWSGGGTAWSKREMARMVFDPVQRRWTLWWGDSEGRWRRVRGVNASADVDTLLAVVDENREGLFD